MENVDYINDISSIVPLFIIGAPRSGTTFLHQLVNSHGSICLTDELRVISWLIMESNKIEQGFDVHGNPYPFNHGQEFANYIKGNAGQILAPFYEALARRNNKQKIRYWGDKYPHYDVNLKVMFQMFPRAKYVMIHRNLKDVMASVKNGHNWDVKKTSNYVTKIYSKYVNVIAESNNQDNVFHIQYETLIKNTIEISKQIFNFLELETTQQLEELILQNSKIQSHSIRKNKNKPVYFDATKESVSRWKRTFNEEDMVIINESLKKIEHVLKIANDTFKVAV